MNNYKKPLIIVVFVGLFFIFFRRTSEHYGSISLLKETIHQEYRAIIIEKFNPREWMEENIAIRVHNNYNLTDEIILRDEILDYIHPGDSIIKIKDENLVIIKKPGGEKRLFILKQISDKMRSRSNFPEAWKDRWVTLDSTTINKWINY